MSAMITIKHLYHKLMKKKYVKNTSVQSKMVSIRLTEDKIGDPNCDCYNNKHYHKLMRNKYVKTSPVQSVSVLSYRTEKAHLQMLPLKRPPV